MPNTVDAYTHRIGRTGRAEREGKGYTFVTTEDRERVVAVERRLGQPIPRREVDGFAAPPPNSRSSPIGPTTSPGPGFRPHTNANPAPRNARATTPTANLRRFSELPDHRPTNHNCHPGSAT